MLCASIKGTNVQEMMANCRLAAENADLIEVRLDELCVLNLEEIKKFFLLASKPLIATLRSKKQGGRCIREEAERLACLRQLASFFPTYLDVERDAPAAFIEELARDYPAVKLILSYHNIEKTPDDLDSIWTDMQRKKAYWYKIAVKSNSSVDMLRLMTWAKNKKHTIAVSMGQEGVPSRVMYPIVGVPVSFGSLNEHVKTAPGQLPIQILRGQYGVSRLTPQSALFGLIGDPVDLSISDRTHNHLMQQLGLDALYVKMKTAENELSAFFEYVRQLPFRGLSVTMPLKESVMPYLDVIDPKARAIGAVNTLLIENGKISGFNTDAAGALNALEEIVLVKNKKIVLLGAGGAAKAIAYEALQRGARLIIINRNKNKAAELANALNCKWACLDNMGQCADNGYDILINTTPAAMPIDEKEILSQAVVMDIKTVPLMPPLLKAAQAKGCKVVCGYHMFVEQAIGQFKLWFGNAVSDQRCRFLLNDYAYRLLYDRLP
jgi:3-dehydroquinate dehydratase/shikimate dehydrogenase